MSNNETNRFDHSSMQKIVMVAGFLQQLSQGYLLSYAYTLQMSWIIKMLKHRSPSLCHLTISGLLVWLCLHATNELDYEND